MKSATPMATGTAMRSASSDAQSVPKMSGSTYQKKLPSASGSVRLVAPATKWLFSAASGKKAGSPWKSRKKNTAARIARMSDPENVERKLKTRSPGRDLAFTDVPASGASSAVIC